MKLVSVFLTRRDIYEGFCYGCCAALPSNHHRYAFADVHTNEGKNRITRHISVERCCDQCAEMDEAIASAASSGMRFTKVGIGYARRIVFSEEYGEEEFSPKGGVRCLCGAASVVPVDISWREQSYGHRFCISCAREHRMLNKTQAEARFISKALKELRAEIKTQSR